ncbi:MAG: hypothetical protein H7840_16805 [Alphaproteobacteria bacterium]
MTVIRRNSARGLKNGNPCAVRIDPKRRWEGRIPISRNLDGEVEEFEDPRFGLRAAVVLILDYAEKGSADTIAKLIRLWVYPGSPAAIPLAAKVARLSGFGADERLDFHRHDHLRRILDAMIHAECRRQPFPDDLLNEALAKAGVRPSTTTTVA